MPTAWEHLQAFSARDQRILLDTIEQQRRHQPNQQTRQRKQDGNFGLASFGFSMILY